MRDAAEADALSEASLWSGSCLCPDGTTYSVGAVLHPDVLEPKRCELACVGGVAGECVRNAPDARPYRKVSCGNSYGVAHHYDSILNPEESMRRYVLDAENPDGASLQQSMLGSATSWVGASTSVKGILYMDLGETRLLAGVVIQKRKDVSVPAPLPFGRLCVWLGQREPDFGSYLHL